MSRPLQYEAMWNVLYIQEAKTRLLLLSNDHSLYTNQQSMQECVKSTWTEFQASFWLMQVNVYVLVQKHELHEPTFSQQTAHFLLDKLWSGCYRSGLESKNCFPLNERIEEWYLIMHQYNNTDSNIYQMFIQKMPRRVNEDANESLNHCSDTIDSLKQDGLNWFTEMNQTYQI